MVPNSVYVQVCTVIMVVKDKKTMLIWAPRRCFIVPDTFRMRMCRHSHWRADCTTFFTLEVKQIMMDPKLCIEHKQ